jgi:hypothetical protein
VLAVQTPKEGNLEIASEVRLAGEDPYLVARDGLLYCATREELAAFNTVTLEKLASVHLVSVLREASIGTTGISGLAVGEEHVYVTLQATPHVLLAEKPQP